jgi:hypothetical protein
MVSFFRVSPFKHHQETFLLGRSGLSAKGGFMHRIWVLDALFLTRETNLEYLKK